MELDEKQYLAYEMIACTFHLGLVKDGNDSSICFCTENNVGGIIKRNSRHCEKNGGKRWSKAITSVSYRACRIKKKVQQ
jgi:hypothetical protein